MNAAQVEIPHATHLRPTMNANGGQPFAPRVVGPKRRWAAGEDKRCRTSRTTALWNRALPSSGTMYAADQHARGHRALAVVYV